MDWVHATISDFGRVMGMEDLRLDEKGILCLEIESMGALYIELQGEKVLVYLVRELPLHQDVDMKEVMALCHFRENLPITVNPCLVKDDQILLLTAISVEQFRLPLLEEIVRCLSGLYDNIL